MKVLKCENCGSVKEVYESKAGTTNQRFLVWKPCSCHEWKELKEEVT